MQTIRHNWHVHLYRTPDESPSTMCNGFIGGHFNPFNVEVGSELEMEVCNEAVGSRYQLRYTEHSLLLNLLCNILTDVSWVI